MDLLKLIRETMEAERANDRTPPELGAFPVPQTEEANSGSEEPMVPVDDTLEEASPEKHEELSLAYPDSHEEAGLSLPEEDEPDFQNLDSTPPQVQNFHEPDEPEVEGQPTEQDNTLQVDAPQGSEEQELFLSEEPMSVENDLPTAEEPSLDVESPQVESAPQSVSYDLPTAEEPSLDVESPQVESAPQSVSYDLPVREASSVHDETLETTSGSADPEVPGVRQTGLQGVAHTVAKHGERVESQMDNQKELVDQFTSHITEEMEKSFSDVRHDMTAFYTDALQDQLMLNRIIGGFV